MNKIEEFLREIVKQVKKLQETIDILDAKLETVAASVEALSKPIEIHKAEQQIGAKASKTKE